MDDKKIVIDAGHGGDDPGASGNNIIEKDMNLEISKYMYNRFRELGIPVKLTREGDETIDPTTRVELIKEAFGDSEDVIVISNHINAGGGEGAEVVYALRNDNELADLVLESIGSEGQIMRKAYQRRLPSDTSKDYYFIHRNTGITEPIIIEYGFLDTLADANRLKANNLLYAEAAVRAILDYIGYGEDTYTVKSGDSLWSIARKFSISVEELKAANDMVGNLLNIGQVLNIPTKVEEPITGEYVVYTVKSGDNLYDIARRYNTTVSELVEYNGLASTSLSVGQRLLIPTVVIEEVEEIEPSYDTYIVQSGDNLYSIAGRYNTSVNELMDINNLSTNLLSLGQKILVPKSDAEELTYTVKSGDNLYGIANKYGVSVDELKSYNNLTSNLLSLGQVLRIPVSNGITYVVKSGDNLYDIARKYDTTVDLIKSKNGLTSNNLSIGQILVI